MLEMSIPVSLVQITSLPPKHRHLKGLRDILRDFEALTDIFERKFPVCFYIVFSLIVYYSVGNYLVNNEIWFVIP